MYCILSQPKSVCTSGRYNGSQMTASGSPTSLVLPFPHQSEVAFRLYLDMEKLLPLIVSRHSPAARQWRCLGNGLGSGSGQRLISAAGSTAACLSSLLHVVGTTALAAVPRQPHASAASSMSQVCGGSASSGSQSQNSFPPNSFPTMAEITLTMSLVVEISETSENLSHYSLFTKYKLSCVMV